MTTNNYCQSYKKGDIGIGEAGPQDSRRSMNSEYETLGEGTSAKEDYMSLVTVDDWGHVIED